MTRAYYNEIDSYAAQWIRNLIDEGVVLKGDVDTRSIVDVKPDDLKGYTQCHFFAGILGWPLALRQAGWPDDRELWTGSCPCQPFSIAGKGDGKDDPRHLWPFWYDLIRERMPPTLFAEQVSDAIRHGWLDLVQDDLERENYAVGSLVAPACCVGAPHIRKRLWIVADRPFDRRGQRDENRTGDSKRDQTERSAGRTSVGRHALKLADAARGRSGTRRAESGNRSQRTDGISRGVFLDNVAHTNENRFESGREIRSVREKQNAEHGRPTLELAHADDARQQGRSRAERDELRPDRSVDALRANREPQGTRPVDGFWRDVDWLLCRDGRWRCSKSIHVRMVDGLSANMGEVRPDTKNEKTGKVNALSFLRETVGSKKVLKRGSGISVNVEKKKILRSDLYGKRSEEKNLPEFESQQDESTQTRENVLLGLRKSWASSRPSYRREPSKQRSLELDDVVFLLSPSLSLAKLHGDRKTEKALFILQQTLCEKTSLSYPSLSVEEIWSSLSKKTTDRMREDFDASRWELVVPLPLKGTVLGRVGMLRAYGNAIVVPLTAAFIETYMSLNR